MYSLGDSIIRPEELIERLKKIGQTAVAITDHGNLYAGVSIYKLCKNADIKYIHGIEFYIYDENSSRDANNKYCHLIALCRNEQGRKNLNRLVTISNMPEHFYYKPRINFSLLEEHKEGLIICSACLAGEIPKLLSQDNYAAAKETALKYKKAFGEDYYLEIQARRDPEQIKINKQIISLAEELGIEVVVTTDAHYLTEEDKSYQEIYAFGGKYKEDGESYIDCYVQSESEVRERISYLKQEQIDRVIANTDAVAEKCNVELPLSAPIMPKVDTPPEYKSNKEWLESLCKKGFFQKLHFDPETGEAIGDRAPEKDARRQYVERYNYELNALEKMGFIDYILLVYSYSNIGERRGIARGSGGGSLINYLTNITDIDPIEHQLYFERFIDVGSLDALEKGEITAKELKVPDIDLDFAGEDCEKVLLWLREKYGQDRVASIGRFGTNHTKGTIRDICKTMEIPLETADAIAKSFGEAQIEELDNLLAAGEKIPENLKEAVGFLEKYPKLFQYVRKLSGLPKSFGLHPCGKIIATADLDEYLPSCFDSNGVRYLQGDMHDVEDVGLVKIDLLGLRTLKQEFDALEMSGESRSFIDPKQSCTDKKVFEIFNTGDTTGIFQFSSSGMKQVLKKMNVGSIDDLSVANALFRPGAIPYIDSFCNRRNGKEETRYIHPDLEPILNNTYGIMVFQEQLIQIGRMAGIHNPDLLRKATAKKKTKLLAQVKPELKEKLIGRGWTEKQFDELWEEILGFGSYSFNKSHASAYAILAYMTAKLKAYYPAEFFCGLLNSYIGESNFVKDESDEIFADIARHKIAYAPLSFRSDHRKCNVEDGKIVYAIPLIKTMNTYTAEVLYKNRNFKGNYFTDLLKALYDDGLRKSTLDTLIRLNFFSEFGNSASLLKLLDLSELMKWGERKSMKKATAEKMQYLTDVVESHSEHTSATYTQIDIPGLLHEYEKKLTKEVIIPEISLKEKLEYQQEMIGLSPFPSGKDEDRPKLYITRVKPLCVKSNGRQFGISVYATSFGSGMRTRFTIKGDAYKRFKEDPIQTGDVIYCRSFTREGGYFNITSWETIYR